jgi:hypothetical protein
VSLQNELQKYNCGGREAGTGILYAIVTMMAQENLMNTASEIFHGYMN